MDLSILKQFGLTSNDIAVYDSLLSIGKTKTGEIIKKSGITSSRVYESLKDLIKKGLVSYEVKNNIRYYQAEVPDRLIEDAKRNQATLQKLSTEIKALPITKKDRNEVNVFEGKRGFKKALTEHVEQLEQGEKISIVAFSNRIKRRGELLAFFRGVDEVMRPKNAEVRMIMDHGFKATRAYTDRLNTGGYTFRFLPVEHFGFNAINISKREVILSVWGDEPMALRITNPVLIDGFKKHFEFLWTQGAKN